MKPNPARTVLLFATVAALAVALSFATAALGSRQVVRSGNLFVADDGGLSPSQLPRHGSAPVTAHIEAEIGTLDGTHPPALHSIDLEVDKTIAIDARGLPVCRATALTARPTKQAEKACEGSLVGRGSAEVEVAFPEQAPFSSSGPVLLFNGGVSGKTTKVLVHAYVDVPAPTAIVTTASVTRIHRGPYGLEMTVQIPRIAGGAGSVTKFTVDVGRRFDYKGRSRSFLSAGCPTGHWSTKGEAEFSDGTKLGLTHIFRCTPTA